MQVVAYDPYVRPESAGPDVRLLDLDAVFAAADAISVHLPLTTETSRIVGRKQLGRLRAGAVLVNTSRGGVIDEDALVECLESGRLAGAGLDVLASEPAALPNSRRLLALDNVVCTPHMAIWY